jgi:hypothetical protein
LRDYLQRQTGKQLELSFIEIERIIGRQLPPSAYSPRWWISGRNCRHDPLWQTAWRSVGYDAVMIRGSDRVEFRKAAER